MADTFAADTRIPAVYANITVVMLADDMRLIFVDRRGNVGRVAATETNVAEIIMPKSVAQTLSEQIQYALGLVPPIAEATPVLQEQQNGGRVF